MHVLTRPYKKMLLATIAAAFGLLFCDRSSAAPPAPSSLVAEQVREVFISQDKLKQLQRGSVTILDARPTAAFKRGHIPGAQHIEWGALVRGDKSGAIHDDDRALQQTLRAIGVSNKTPVVVYGAWHAGDAWGEEGRLFWSLVYLGHKQVYILDGGFAAWSAEATNAPATGEASAARVGDFTLRRQAAHRASAASIEATLDDPSLVLLDTREAVEFKGRVKYGEARGGHIPGAKHLWWHDLLGADGALLDKKTLQGKLSALGVHKKSRVVPYCTGGIRSGFVFAVLYALGYEVQNYDASMWEWAADPKRPLSTP